MLFIKDYLSKNKMKIIIILLIIIIVIFRFLNYQRDNKKTGSLTNDVNIKMNPINKLSTDNYQSDVFSMKKPSNWKIEAAGSGIYYAIRVYDPNDDRNQIFLMLKIQPLLKSYAAKKSWSDYSALNGNNSQYKLFADAVVLDDPTTYGFYKKFNEVSSYVKVYGDMAGLNFPTINEFTKLEEFESNASMKSVAMDSKVLRATYKNQNDNVAEGLFSASIVNFGNQNQNGVDMLYYMVYDIMFVSSAKDEFINYKDILLECVNSINFTDEYVKKTIDDSNYQTKKSLEINASIQKSFDSYMSAWENRNKTYDIMSQKQSDATLGYERVYDTDTGDIYKAYNGFSDDYKGDKFKSVTDDMYTFKVYGYIEK